MKYPQCIGAATAFALLCALPCPAQKNDDWAKMSHSKPRASSEKRFKHKEKIEVTYDKFKDITMLKLDPLRVGDGVYFSAASFARGNVVPPQAAGVQLFFKLYNDTWRCLQGCSVIFIVDGERMRLGTADHVSRELNEVFGVMEAIAVEVSFNTFRKIADGTSVEFQAGTDEAGLKDNHLAALRDFAGRMRP